MTSAICVYDFTSHEQSASQPAIKSWLKEYAKAWCFQLEKGEETGKEHFQGRFSLKVAKRINQVIEMTKELKFHISPTSKSNHGNMFYVSKAETRVDGPWKDTDADDFIPWQYQNITLKPFQQTIIDSSMRNDFRKIDCIIDTKGGSGKSTVAAIGELKHGFIDLPPVNDAKDLMQVMCNICKDGESRTPGVVFMDMPRAMPKYVLSGLYAAVEQIKKGKLYDMRYHYKSYWINSPRIWVFTNVKPDLNWLSLDRWNFWTIVDDKLVPLTEVSGGTSACNNIETSTTSATASNEELENTMSQEYPW